LPTARQESARFGVTFLSIHWGTALNMMITLLYDDADFLPFEIALEADRDGTVSSRASFITSLIRCDIFASLLR
jgi:hypothetical protein